MGAIRERRRGQGLTEYVIVVGLIGILLVVAVGALSDALARAYAGATFAVEQVAAGVEASAPPDAGPPTSGPPPVRNAGPCKHGRGFVHPVTRVCGACGAIVPR